MALSQSNNLNSKWYFYRPKIIPTVGSGKVTLQMMLQELMTSKNFDSRLNLSRNNDSTLLIYEMKKNSLDNYIYFHFFKIKGKIDDLIADLNTGTFTKVSDEIRVTPSRGLLKQCTCCFDLDNNVLAWQSSKSPTIEDFRYYLQTIFHHNISFLPIKDPKSDKYFRLMDVSKLAIEVSIPTINNALALSSLSPDQRVSVLGEYMRQANASNISVTLTNDEKEGQNNLNKEFVNNEVEFFKSIMALLPKKSKLIATGNVSDNSILEKKVIDLVEGLMIFGANIPEFSKTKDYFEVREQRAIEAVIYYRKEI